MFIFLFMEDDCSSSSSTLQYTGQGAKQKKFACNTNLGRVFLRVTTLATKKDDDATVGSGWLWLVNDKGIFRTFHGITFLGASLHVAPPSQPNSNSRYHLLFDTEHLRARPLGFIWCCRLLENNTPSFSGSEPAESFYPRSKRRPFGVSSNNNCLEQEDKQERISWCFSLPTQFKENCVRSGTGPFIHPAAAVVPFHCHCHLRHCATAALLKTSSTFIALLGTTMYFTVRAFWTPPSRNKILQQIKFL